MFGNKVSNTDWRLHHRNDLGIPGSAEEEEGDESSSNSSSKSLSGSSSSSSRNEWDPIITYDESDSRSWDESIYTDGLQADVCILMKPYLYMTAPRYESITESASHTFNFAVSFNNAAIVDLVSCYTENQVEWSFSDQDGDKYDYSDWYAENNRTSYGCTWDAGPATWHLAHRYVSGSVTYGVGMEDKSMAGIAVEEAWYYLYAIVTLEPGLKYSDLAVTLSGSPGLKDRRLYVTEHCFADWHDYSVSYREAGSTGRYSVIPNLTYN